MSQAWRDRFTIGILGLALLGASTGTAAVYNGWKAGNEQAARDKANADRMYALVDQARGEALVSRQQAEEARAQAAASKKSSDVAIQAANAALDAALGKPVKDPDAR